jgi:hypothetical protein
MSRAINEGDRIQFNEFGGAMAESTYSLRMQKVSRGYVVKADNENVTKELVFQTWDDFAARFTPYIEPHHGAGWMAQLKEQVEKVSYGLSVLPNNGRATEEVVKELGFFAEDKEPVKGKQSRSIIQCPDCQGTGKVMGRNCLTCDGRGTLWSVNG